ncbi:MAG: beta-lactamase family protein [Alphaproteobacteria bacterium]|nr:beta-lactamase family protein [Alphaproteobacteria bacterium]
MRPLARTSPILPLALGTLALAACGALPLAACGDKDADDSGSSDGGTDSGGGDGVTRVGCEARHDAFIAALEAELAAQDGPGVSAAIMEGGEITCRVALGFKDWETETPVDVDTLFQLGSTTKMFTSVALLQQIEAGTYGLETSLAETYPDSEFALGADWNDQIEMEHLLTHQGAFYDYIDWGAGPEDEDLAVWHDTVFFPYLWLMATPGDFWNYSNPNFDVAGLVVEHHDPTGRWYRDIMEADVFGPLGMARTVMGNDHAEALGNYSESYGLWITATGEAREGEVPFEKTPDLAHGRPAGANTWSTPTDMLHMARFLMDGDPAVLDDALRQSMTDKHVLVPSAAWAGIGYGYGVFVGDGVDLSDGYHETPIWDHGGNTLSFTSAFYVLPEHDFAISVLSSGQGTSWGSSISTAMSTLVALGGTTAAPSAPWDPDGLDAHVGTYVDENNVGEIVIWREGDSLHASMPLLESLGYVVTEELEPASTDTFWVLLDGYAYDLTFVDAGGDGESDYVVNRAFVGTRTDATETLAGPAFPGLRRPLAADAAPRPAGPRALGPTPLRPR